MNLERLMQTVFTVGGAALGVLIVIHESIAVHGSKGLIHDIGFAAVFGIIGSLMGFACGLPAAFLIGLVVAIPFYALEQIKKVFHISEGVETDSSSEGFQAHSRWKSSFRNPRAKKPPRKRRY